MERCRFVCVLFFIVCSLKGKKKCWFFFALSFSSAFRVSFFSVRQRKTTQVERLPCNRLTTDQNTNVQSASHTHVYIDRFSLAIFVTQCRPVSFGQLLCHLAVCVFFFLSYSAPLPLSVCFFHTQRPYRVCTMHITYTPIDSRVYAVLSIYKEA